MPSLCPTTSIYSAERDLGPPATDQSRLRIATTTGTGSEVAAVPRFHHPLGACTAGSAGTPPASDEAGAGELRLGRRIRARSVGMDSGGGSKRSEREGISATQGPPGRRSQQSSDQDVV